MRKSNKDRASVCGAIEKRRLPGNLKKCDHLKDPRKRDKCRRTVSRKSAQRARECQFF